jgi:hypothetical protein
VIPDGSSLREIVNFIQENYPMYDFELRCYFCRANESSTVYGANDELDKVDVSSANELVWDPDKEGLDFFNTTE